MSSISVIGAGPVGLMVACLLAPRYNVTVYEKREQYQRDHELDLTGPVIGELLHYCDKHSDHDRLSSLATILTGWKDKRVTTFLIEEELKRQLLAQDVPIIHQSVTDPMQVDDSLIIACDGARSSIRATLYKDLINNPKYHYPELTDVQEWGHLLIMRFTTSINTTPRKTISNLVYNIPSAMNGLGVDHESFHSLTSSSSWRKVSLYLPISSEIYQKLDGDVWTMEGLRELGDPLSAVVDHLRRYRLNLELRGGHITGESINVIPLKGYRASAVSYACSINTVFLAGDASSGLIYRRGLKKGWMEACFLASELMRVADKEASLDDVMYSYQEFCTQLYNSECRHIKAEQQHTNTVNSGLAVAGIGILALAAVGLALVLRR